MDTHDAVRFLRKNCTLYNCTQSFGPGRSNTRLLCLYFMYLRTKYCGETRPLQWQQEIKQRVIESSQIFACLHHIRDKVFAWLFGENLKLQAPCTSFKKPCSTDYNFFQCFSVGFQTKLLLTFPIHFGFPSQRLYVHPDII